MTTKTRDDEFAELAAQYIEAHGRYKAALAIADQAARNANEAKLMRDAIAGMLTKFVGRNQPVKNAVVGGELVRVENRPGKDATQSDTATVTVEPVQFGPTHGGDR